MKIKEKQVTQVKNLVSEVGLKGFIMNSQRFSSHPYHSENSKNFRNSVPRTWEEHQTYISHYITVVHKHFLVAHW